MGTNSRRISNPFRELAVMRESLPDISAPSEWRLLSYFIKVSDKALLKKTCGSFPGGKSSELISDSSTHPVILLKRVGNFSYRFCPCSTKNYRGYSMIPDGTRLEPGAKQFHPDGYICHPYTFNLPPDNDIVLQSNFFGIVREHDIVGEQYKEGMK